jgi:hypothetical protein
MGGWTQRQGVCSCRPRRRGRGFFALGCWFACFFGSGKVFFSLALRSDRRKW